MTLHMNEDYDIPQAIRRFDDCAPNRAHVARVVRNLADWTNNNSDGWAYWVKPVRAASKALDQIVSRTHVENTHQETNDLTRAQALAVVRPIRAFLTRHGVDKETADQIMAG